MAIDLSKMNDKDLAKLQKDLEKELTTREKSKRDEARKAAEDAARKHGFKLDELLGTAKSSSRKPPQPPKFRNPANPQETWSGRGRQPGWYKEALAAGTDPKKLAI